MENNSLEDKVVLITTTLYNPNCKSDMVRAELAKRTFNEALNFNYEILAVDGGSSKEFLDEIENKKVKIFQQLKKGMGNSRRQANEEAYKTGKEIIVWIDPEKHSLIPKIQEMSRPILENKADLIIPRRNSLDSLPKAQQHLEDFSNEFFRELTGLDFDVGAGCRLYKRDLINYFINYRGEYGDKWEILIIPILNALQDGKRALSIDIDYLHDRKQTEIEEHDINFYRKRIAQLENFTNAIYYYWKKIGKL